MHITNLHERRIEASATAAGALIDTLARGEADRLWPWERWIPQRLDGPLAVGAHGGHGAIRYHVVAYEPGRVARYGFEPSTGFRGTHAFELIDIGEPDAVVLRHVLVVETGLEGRLSWALAIRWLHDALIEDALDKAERELTGTLRRPARWSLWVRLLRRVAGKRLSGRGRAAA